MKERNKESDIDGDGYIIRPRKSNAEKLHPYRAKELNEKVNGNPG